MDIKELLPKDTEGRLRIIQETVPGRQITLAHVITSPKPIVYRKLGLNPDIDFDRSAIGIITVTPSESAVIGADIAIKSGDVYLGFVDRFSGTLISDRTYFLQQNLLFKAVIHYFQNDLGYATCPVTKKQNRNHGYIMAAKKWNSNRDINSSMAECDESMKQT